MKTLLYILCGFGILHGLSFAINSDINEANTSNHSKQDNDLDDELFPDYKLSDADLKKFVNKSLNGDHDATFKVAMHYDSEGDVQNKMLWLKRGYRANHDDCSWHVLMSRFYGRNAVNEDRAGAMKDAIALINVNKGAVKCVVSFLLEEHSCLVESGTIEEMNDFFEKALKYIKLLSPALEKHNDPILEKRCSNDVLLLLRLMQKDIDLMGNNSGKKQSNNRPVAQVKIKKEVPPKELISAGLVKFKSISGSFDHTNMSWKVVLKNNTNKHLKCYVLLKVKDKEGFLVKDRTSDDVILKPFEEKSVSDTILFDNRELNGGIKGFPEVKQIEKAY